MTFGIVLALCFARHTIRPVQSNPTAAQDEDAVHLEMKVEAEQNARRDTDSFQQIGLQSTLPPPSACQRGKAVIR